jgi:hypothetical protein
MAKSIRSKQMKRHRAVMRRTVGEAQEAKQNRHALRRLRRAVAEQEVAKAEGASGSAAAVAGAGSTLSALGAVLRGGAAAAASSSSSSSSAATSVDAEKVAAAISVPAGPPRNKKLRYTFNSALRESRIAGDIEDLTDDEEDVRLGRIDKLAKRAAGKDVDEDDEIDEVLMFDAEKMGKDTSVVDFAEIFGVRKPAHRNVAKRGELAMPDSGVEGLKGTYTVGFYDTDPVFKNKKRTKGGSHRKGAIKEKIAEAALGKPKK